MIAREGMIPIGIAVAAGAAVFHFAGVAWSLPLWALAAYLAYSFRETIPEIPNQPLAVLSPGDGSVRAVSSQRDPWLDRDARRVRIDLGGLGMGVLRSPVEGKVVEYWTADQPFNRPGTLSAPGNSPNCYSVQISTDEGDDLVFAVSSLRPISRFKLYVAPGERVGIGQRIGFLYFGNIIDVYLPATASTDVAPGARTVAGSTVLGSLQAVAGRGDVPAETG